MYADTMTLRLSYSPLNFMLGAAKKRGLRIGYMESALRGFYLNSIDTGIQPPKLTSLLYDEYPYKIPDCINELFQFLIDEGDRASYQKMYPYLLSSNSLEEFENNICKQFLGAESLIQQGSNLFKFKKYAEYRREPLIWMNDIERGIICWDMGRLVCLARTALKYGYITLKEAWEYIELAGELSTNKLHSPQEIDKSFLIGWAMKTENINEWDRAMAYFSLIKQRKI